MKRADKVWGRGKTTAVLLMHVKVAIPHVAKGNLINKMEEMGFEVDLVSWVESVTQERKVIMSMDVKQGNSIDMKKEVPYGLPVSLVVLIIYCSGLFSDVEEKEEESKSEVISFVDDVALVVDGGDVGECNERLETCAATAHSCATQTACLFDIEKPKAVLFT